MLQAPDPFVPIVPANPEDATDVKGFLDSILAEMTAGAAPEILDTGMLLWRGLAAVLVVWTGLRIAFTGDFRPWDLIRLVIALWIPWSMLNFYNTALPGATVSFPGAVVGGGNWLQTVLVGNIGSDWMDAYLDLARNIFSRGTEVDTGSGLWTMIWTGLASIQSTVLGVINTLLFQVFLCIMALLLLALYAVTMAQVMWAQIALAMLLILGPMFIPFLLIEPLAFLFWGWFKALWTYSLYGAIAAAIMRVFPGRVAGIHQRHHDRRLGRERLLGSRRLDHRVIAAHGRRHPVGADGGEPRHPTRRRGRRWGRRTDGTRTVGRTGGRIEGDTPRESGGIGREI